jgi:hypothetical protein
MLYAMEIKNVLKISVYPFLVIKSFEGGMLPHSKVRSVRVYILQQLF